VSSELWSTSPWEPIQGGPTRDPLPPVPRLVPFSTRMALATHGTLSILGFAFFAMGMFMLCAMFSPIDLARGPLARMADHVVEGSVTSIYASNTTVNEERVMAVDARFQLEGTTHTVTSFSVHPGVEVGATVPVHVDPSSPSIAVIGSLGSSTMPWFAVPFMFFFPAIGAAFMAYTASRGLRWAKLLERGVETEGTLISNEPTGARVNNQPVHRVTFHFQDAAGDTWPVVAKAVDTRRLEDEPTERVLYFPHDPRTAVVVDEIPAWLVAHTHGWSTPPSGTMSGVWLRVLGTLAVICAGIAINVVLL